MPDVRQILIAPTTNTTATRSHHELDGRRITLLLRPDYSGGYHLWIEGADGSRICGPLRLVPGLDIWGSCHHDPRIPPGQLFVTRRPTPETADRSALLLYRPQ